MKGKKIMTVLVVVAFVFSTLVVLNKVTDIDFVEEASALTPGTQIWYNNGSVTNTNNYKILNNSDSSLIYGYEGLLYANGQIDWGDEWYYLYYPVYDGDHDTSPYNLSWFNYTGVGSGSFAPRINGGNGPRDWVFGNNVEKDVRLNHSGLWVIANDDSNINCSTTDSIIQTVAAWFWVNASSTIETTISEDAWEFGDTDTFDLSVTLPDAITDARISISNETGYMLQGPGTFWLWNRVWTDVNSQLGGVISKNASTFANAGHWYVNTFYDVDGAVTPADRDGEGLQAAYYTPVDYMKWFNASTYGSTGARWTAISDDYTYATCGPWDPPEYNDTVKIITVSAGKPVVSLKNTSNIYWGYDLVIEINATDKESPGQGLTGCNISLRNQAGTSTIFDGDYFDIFINESSNGNYTITIPRYSSTAGVNGVNWTALSNASWYIAISKDINHDGIDEWNVSKRVTIRSTSPPVRLTVTNDGDGTTDDLKVNVPAYTTVGNVVGTVETLFTIYGRSVSGVRAYYGDGTGATPEDRFNISVTGDILYPVGDTVITGMSHLEHQGNGLWKLTWTPTRPGGSITIKITWPGTNNGTDSATINIINGTTIVPAIEAFTIGEKTIVTVNVANMGGAAQEYATVEMVWFGTTTQLNATTGTSASGRGENGDYSFIVTNANQVGKTAPNNITIAANTPGFPGGAWGYAKVRINRNHNLHVNVTTSPIAGTSIYAGNGQEYDIEVLTDGTTVPKTYSDFTIALYHPDGTIVSGTDAWSDTAHYQVENEEIILGRGTYEVYVYNDTHDSQGHNGTLIVEGYTVTCTPSVLAWLIDQSVNVTFNVNSPVTNGTLTINNMTSAPNGTNTEAGTSIDIDITEGIGTLNEVNATDLGNFTFEYFPEGGSQRSANGVLRVTTATAAPTPDTIYINEPTTIEIIVTHPATGGAVPNVRVGLDHAINNTASKLTQKPDDQITDADGKVQFSVMSAASGEITIYIKNGSDANNKFVITSTTRKTMTITTDPSVNERGTFIVSAKDGNGDLITDKTVSVVFDGNTYTATTGQTEAITAPEVTESLDYTITATAEGYSNDDTSIKIINVPKIYASAPKSVEKGKSFIVKAGGDDGNNNGILVTIYKNGEEKASEKTVNGEAKFTLSATGTYTIEATKDDYDPADELKIKITEPAGTPGFELLTLIAAIGVAFILLRRRRK